MNQRLLGATGLLLFLLFTSFFFTSTANARNWTKYQIPGAFCGTGAPYKIWVHKKNESKLALEFMGGGACWSADTCLGRNLRNWPFPIPSLPVMSVMGSQIGGLSPLSDHSMIYFPYCTGDVHAGSHTVIYPGTKTRIYHVGKTNVEKALQYLSLNKIIKFNKLEEITLYGASAGAIGAFLHTRTVENYLGHQTKKTLITDSPGLHFGKLFWQKFSRQMVNDFQLAFSTIGVQLDLNQGNISPQVPKVCDYLFDWNIGMLQASKDIVMSKVFGDITPSEHRRLIYSDEGAYNQARVTKNCSVWINDSSQHTFLLFPHSIYMKAGNMRALEFARQIHKGRSSIFKK